MTFYGKRGDIERFHRKLVKLGEEIDTMDHRRLKMKLLKMASDVPEKYRVTGERSPFDVQTIYYNTYLGPLLNLGEYMKEIKSSRLSDPLIMGIVKIYLDRAYTAIQLGLRLCA